VPRVPQATGGHGKLQPIMRFQGPLIPANIAVEDDSLPSDDDSTSMWHLMTILCLGVIVMMVEQLLLVVSHD